MLGLSVAVQLWQVVPLAIVVVSVAMSRQTSPGGWRHPVLALLVSAVTAAAAVCLPFLLAAPYAFLRFVVLDQVGRPSLQIPIVTRLHDLEGFAAVSSHPSAAVSLVVVALAIGGLAAIAFVAWRAPATRMWCALLVVEMTYLLLGPVFISHYSGWTAPAGAIVLGTAAAVVLEMASRRGRFGWVAHVGYLTVIAAIALVTIPRHDGMTLPVAALERDIASAACVAADAPVLLIETGALGRDLRAGCALVVDPTGTSYDTDRGRLLPGPLEPSRRAATGYQRAMLAYYSKTDAALFVRDAADGLTTATEAGIAQRLPVTVEHGPVTVRLRTPSARRGGQDPR